MAIPFNYLPKDSVETFVDIPAKHWEAIFGKKKQAYFRLVVLPHTYRPQGKYLELLGSYDPHLNKLEAKKERIEHWIKQGAKLSPTANNLLINYKYIEGEKVKAWRPKVNSKKKAKATAETPTPAPAPSV